MMSEPLAHYDTIVIGLGVMGAATCMELAKRGQHVLGIEQGSIPHALGSSHGETRVIRLCYYEHPDYVPLLRRAYEGWDAIGRSTGRTLLHLTGGIYMGPPDGAFIAGTRRAAETHGLEHEVLELADLRRRFPMFGVSPDMAGIWEPMAGAIMAEASVSACVERALHDGAHVHGHEQVRDWSADANRVRVETDRGVYHAEQLCICGGPWSGRLLGDLTLPLVVTRQVLGWIWPRDPSIFQPGRFPVWGMDDPDGHFHYGFPMLPGRPGLKVARHWIGPVTDPHTIDRSPGAEDRMEIEQLVQKTLPEAAGPVLSLSVCMYTNTPDGHFILGRHPHMERVCIAGGFSGHGFKFAPVIGEALADLVTRGRTDHPIEFFSPSRFV